MYATVLVKALQRALAEWTAAQCARQLGPLLPCLPREGAAGLGALGAATTDAAALPRLEAGNEVAPAIPQDTLAAQVGKGAYLICMAWLLEEKLAAAAKARRPPAPEAAACWQCMRASLGRAAN